MKLTRLGKLDLPKRWTVSDEDEVYHVSTDDIKGVSTPTIIYLVKTTISGNLKNWILKDHSGTVINTTKVAVEGSPPDEWIVATLQRKYPEKLQEDAQETIEEPVVLEYDLTKDFALCDALQYSMEYECSVEIHDQIERDFPEVSTLFVDSQALRLEAEALILKTKAKLMRAMRLASYYSRKVQELDKV